MGKRFGRNQKRAFRTKIRGLSQEVETGQEEISRLKAEADVLSGTIDRMVEIIERVVYHSAAVPPRKMFTDRLSKRLGRHEIKAVLKEQMGFSLEDPSPPVGGRCKTVNLYELECAVEKCSEEMGYAVHMELFSKGSNKAYYMISRDALLTMPSAVITERFLPSVIHRLFYLIREKEIGNG